MEKKSPLAMARKLDEKADQLSTEEAELVDELLPKLRTSRKVKPAELAQLEKVYDKYFGEDADEDDGEEEDEGSEGDEEEIDEDDFV